MLAEAEPAVGSGLARLSALFENHVGTDLEGNCGSAAECIEKLFLDCDLEVHYDNVAAGDETRA